MLSGSGGQAPAWFTTVLLLVPLLLPSASGNAQTFRGKLVQAGSGAPVDAALVRLLDAAGQERDAALTDGEGRFGVTSDTTGEHRLAVERIGFETWHSDPFTLEAGATRSEDVSISVRPVQLSEIRAEGERRCRLRLREGETLTRLWEEARKALDRERRSELDGNLRLRLRTWRRVLGSDRTVLSERSDTKVKQGTRSYMSPPVEELLSEGFVQRRDDGLHFFGPDAEVLLSQAFRETHCFRLVPRDSRGEGLLGVAFEPVEGREVAEVEGVLWLDPETAELQDLEFRYTGHGLPIPEGSARGRVEFTPLPTGQWIVRRWWIRWPEVVEQGPVGARGVDAEGAYRYDRDLRVTQYAEKGGELLDVEVAAAPADTPGAGRRSRGGSVVGTVYDSLRGGTLPDATVRLVGTEHATETDERGWFSLKRVPPGRYRLGFRHPELPVIDERITGMSVDVREDGVYTTRLFGPGPASVVDLLCDEPEMGPRGPGGSGVVAGLVRDTGAAVPLPGATVRLTWRDTVSSAGRLGRGAGSVPYRAAVETDSTGLFVACGVPLDRNVRISAVSGEAREVRLTPEDPAGVVTLSSTPEPLAADPVPLPGVGVSVEPEVRRRHLREFRRRKELGNGRFIEGSEVGAHGVIGAFRRLPNVQVRECRRRGLVITGCYRLTTVARGNTLSLTQECSPAVYLDGTRIGQGGEFAGTAFDALRSLPADAIEGIEVHGPSTVPARFGGLGSSCGVVLVWTGR